MISSRVTSQIRSFVSTHRQALLVSVFVLIGVVTILATKAAVLNSVIEPEDESKTPNVQIVTDPSASGGGAVRFKSAATTGTQCGKVVQNYSYDVPFGDAIWNQPICGLPRHPRSVDYANRLYQWGHENDGSPAMDVKNGKIRTNPGYPKTNQLAPLAGLFTREVYYVSQATNLRQTKIGTLSYYSNLDGEDVNTFTPETTIPWDPSWQTSQGGDNEMVILDDRFDTPTGGRIYFISGYWSPDTNPLLNDKFPFLQCQPYFSSNRLCTFRVSVGRDLNGDYIDYRDYEGYISNRGVGLSFLATLTLPEEVKAGEIRHALGLAIPNPAFGPKCEQWQLGDSDEEGYKCGTAVAPATKFEQADDTVHEHINELYRSYYTQDKNIPEGMLFALDMTYEEIDIWVNSRTDLNATRKKTAKTFAIAMKDYGMMIVDTNGNSPAIQTAGGVNPINAAEWTKLGMGPNDPDNLLDGLITANNLYVVDPPLATCKNGTVSQYYCQWTSIRYGN